MTPGRQWYLTVLSTILAIGAATAVHAQADQSRLKRPAATTFGQSIVSTYSFKTPAELDRFLAYPSSILCAVHLRNGPLAAVLRYLVDSERKKMSDDDRRKFDDHDPRIVNSVATSVVAGLDDIDPAAITADENIGPGVYHTPIIAIGHVIAICPLG